MTTADVPLIDIAACIDGDADARRRVARRFGAAFESHGFAAIVNHGVDEPMVQATYAAVQSFFMLPLPAKQTCTAPERAKGRGYLPMGIESVAATLSGETPADLCEALVFAAIHKERAGSGLPNFWPAEPPGLADSVNAYFDAMRTLGLRLMRLSALALELPEDHFDACFAEPSLTLRFVNYPDQPEPPAEGQLRYGAHHDYGGLTILRQDEAPGGLQVCDANGQWCDAPIHRRSFMVNVGDLMSRWTNGRWRSTLHRVVNPSRAVTGSTRRLSLVAFTGPNEQTLVECLPTCRPAAQPPRFEPVEAGAYVRAKIAASMDLRATT